MDINEEHLWDEYVKEENKDYSAIMYVVRYDYNRIKRHQQSIIRAIKNNGFKITYMEEQDCSEIIRNIKKATDFKIITYKEQDSLDNRINILSEELSTLNEALYFLENSEYHFRKIEDLTRYLLDGYLDFKQTFPTQDRSISEIGYINNLLDGFYFAGTNGCLNSNEYRTIAEVDQYFTDELNEIIYDTKKQNHLRIVKSH